MTTSPSASASGKVSRRHLMLQAGTAAAALSVGITLSAAPTAQAAPLLASDDIHLNAQMAEIVATYEAQHLLKLASGVKMIDQYHRCSPYFNRYLRIVAFAQSQWASY